MQIPCDMPSLSANECLLVDEADDVEEVKKGQEWCVWRNVEENWCVN
jgi:hypothetical protein